MEDQVVSIDRWGNKEFAPQTLSFMGKRIPWRHYTYKGGEEWVLVNKIGQRKVLPEGVDSARIERTRLGYSWELGPGLVSGTSTSLVGANKKMKTAIKKLRL